MTEKKIRWWIDKSENKPELKAQILEILPTAYGTQKKEQITIEDKFKSLKQYASKKNTRPSVTTTDTTKYHKMTEKQLRGWIDRSENKPERKAQILEILPTAYGN